MATKEKNALHGITVAEAMRRQVNHLQQTTTISNSINTFIKYKVSGLLTVEDDGTPAGVLSKTDVMGAYYAGLPINSPLEYVMSSPPLFCGVEEPLEKALELMRDHSVYRLYVVSPEEDAVIGVLAYPDIVGLLYKYCYYCDYSTLRKSADVGSNSRPKMKVKDCMTDEVFTVGLEASLSEVMESLSMNRMGALLVTDHNGMPAGVISKTDLVLAYKHGVDPGSPAKEIMSGTVQFCMVEDLIEEAIRKMIFSDVHRLFVKKSTSEPVIGVFSLSDAARNRSGSCHACISSRIRIET